MLLQLIKQWSLIIYWQLLRQIFKIIPDQCRLFYYVVVLIGRITGLARLSVRLFVAYGFITREQQGVKVELAMV